MPNVRWTIICSCQLCLNLYTKRRVFWCLVVRCESHYRPFFIWILVITATNLNGQNLNGHKPKRPQTGTATDRNGHKPKRPQTETATDRNGHKPKRPQTGTATNRNGHQSARPQIVIYVIHYYSTRKFAMKNEWWLFTHIFHNVQEQGTSRSSSIFH